MSIHTICFAQFVAASALLLVACGDGSDAPTRNPSTFLQAVNTFQNGTATGGVPLTVDVKGPAPIANEVEFPGFAFGTYDVDASADSVTLRLVADLANLQVTQYDATTFDRYYFVFDEMIPSASISSGSHPGFAATVEVIPPQTTISTAGAFVEGLPSEFTFESGGILITIGDGTDLNAISAGNGSLTIDF